MGHITCSDQQPVGPINILASPFHRDLVGRFDTQSPEASLLHVVVRRTALAPTSPEAGDFPRIVLGVAVMSICVIIYNRLLWRPLFGYAERRLRVS